MDSRLKAVREDEVVGRGTCTEVDEAMTDEEVLQHLDNCKIVSPKLAVVEMRHLQELHGERRRDIESTAW